MQERSETSQKKRRYKSNDFGDKSLNNLDFLQRSKLYLRVKEENLSKLEDKYYGTLDSKNNSRSVTRDGRMNHN
jgi:hypothetical protein